MEGFEHLKALDKAILKYAHWIDNLDMYLGPYRSAASLTGSETLEGLNWVSKAIDYAVLKGPFITLYLARTKDYAALMDWIPKEMVSLSVPYGGLIELLRNYERRAMKYYDKKKE